MVQGPDAASAPDAVGLAPPRVVSKLRVTGPIEESPVPPDPRPSRTRTQVAAYVCLVVLAAVAVVVLTTRPVGFGRTDLLRLLALTVTAVCYDVVARRIELLRRRTTSGPYITTGAVWTFAAASLLPPVYVAILAAILNFEEEFFARRAGNPKPLYRILFNISAIVIPAWFVHVVLEIGHVRSDLAMSSATPEVVVFILASLVAYALSNAGIVGIVLFIVNRRLTWRATIGSASETVFEFATLSLGALLAVAIALNPLLVLLAVPILTLLQRVALVDYLESAASEDTKTGLLNSAAWNHVAERELLRSASRHVPASVMVIDLDHFKRVNDTWGHLTGDAVLVAVAQCMTGMLRERDLVSRFGGEEFTALLPGADAIEAHRIADRLRLRIADLTIAPVGDRSNGDGTVRVTASVGIASYPFHGDSVPALLAKADAALYGAKSAGRNRVHVHV